jgi:competence protein ComEC
LRGRMFIYACAAALGGAVGKAGLASTMWLMVPGALLSLLAVFTRKRGWKAGCSLACMLFFCAGLYLGHTRYTAWRDRGGEVGEASLRGEVDVGCRGERGDILEILEVTEVLSGEVARAGDRYLLRKRYGAPVSPRWGDKVLVKGQVFLFEREDGGICGSLVADELELLSHTGNPLLRLALAYRDVFQRRMKEVEDTSASGLIEGMVLGDYRMLSARDLRSFRLTGLIHLCAASGLHLAILAGFVIWLGRRARLPARTIMALNAPILLVYALAVGLSIPIMRAAVIALLAAAAFFLGRDFDLIPAMGIAILYLVWKDPGAAAGVSFQLCFVAALGMVLLYRSLGKAMGGGGSKALALLAATLAAQLAVGPILLYHFGEVSLLAPLSNLLVLPLVPAVMALAMLSSLLEVAGLPAAGALMQAAVFLSRGIIVVARNLASPGWTVLRIYPLHPMWMAVYYPALAAALLAGGSWRRIGRVALAVLLAIALCAGVLPNLSMPGAEKGIRITFIDVGQGDATLLQMPSGATVLVDGGLEEGVLAADLRTRGVRCIDAVVFSHPDADHIGGLEAALENCEVGMLVHPATKSTGQAGRLLALAEECGVEVKTMRAGDHLRLDDLTLAAYGPPRVVPEAASTNEYSLVLRAEGAGFSLLLTGDVEEEGENMLMDSAVSLESDILKVPHHGGFCEENEEFFYHIDPEIAVVSVGEDNPYGHPSWATLEALEQRGCAVYRTDQCGDIVIHVVQGGYRVERER